MQNTLILSFQVRLGGLCVVRAFSNALYETSISELKFDFNVLVCDERLGILTKRFAIINIEDNLFQIILLLLRFHVLK